MELCRKCFISFVSKLGSNVLRVHAALSTKIGGGDEATVVVVTQLSASGQLLGLVLLGDLGGLVAHLTGVSESTVEFALLQNILDYAVPKGGRVRKGTGRDGWNTVPLD